MWLLLTEAVKHTCTAGAGLTTVIQRLLWCVQLVRKATTVPPVSSCATVSTPRHRATRSPDCVTATLDTGVHDVTAVSGSLRN